MRAETVLAVKPLGDEADRLSDRPLPSFGREERLGLSYQPVEDRKEARDERWGWRGDPIAHRFRRLGKQFPDRDAMRVACPRLQCHQHQDRNEKDARPVRYLVQVKWEPAGQQHDLNRHHRDCTPRNLAEQGQRDHGRRHSIGARRRARGSPRAPGPYGGHRPGLRQPSAQNRR